MFPSSSSSFPSPLSSPLIPRELLFGVPDYLGPQVSPKGNFLAYLAPKAGIMNLWIAPLDDLTQARCLTSEDKRDIRQFWWGVTNDHLLYTQDYNGDENWQLLGINIPKGTVTPVTPAQGVQARVESFSAYFPETVVISLNERDSRYHDLYSLDLKTWSYTLLDKNEKFRTYVFDSLLRPRFASEPIKNGNYLIYLNQEKGAPQWQPWLEIPLKDIFTTRPLGIHENTAYFSDSRDHDTAALVSIDIVTKEKNLIFHDPQADIGEVLWDTSTKKPQAVSVNFLKNTWHILDPAYSEDFDALRQLQGDDIKVLSQSQDQNLWIISTVSDVQLPVYYVFNRSTKVLTKLFHSHAALEKFPLNSMHPVVITARDGISLISYLSLPHGISFNEGKFSGKPVPLVLKIRGGPWLRDEWGYDPEHQWHTNRGYAVLTVNYRGSVGLGKKILCAGIGEWGKDMEQDLIDAVQWTIDQGITDPEKICIYGRSYGGYATLMGIAKHSIFCCAVELVGISDLTVMLDSLPPYWEVEKFKFRTWLADKEQENGRKLLKERSPLTHVSSIKTPLLIGHGATDMRVNRKQSDIMAAEMEKQGLRVTYILYPNEGHQFIETPSRLSFYAIAEFFLSGFLKGPCELVPPLEKEYFEVVSDTQSLSIL